MPRLAFRSVVGIAAAALLAALPAACNRQPEGAAKVAVIGEMPKRLEEPSGSLSAGQAVLLANAAQGLVRLDARGQIEPGLAERWNVSDDGLSYIFRLVAGEWPDGRKISAHQVARMMRQALSPKSENRLKDALGAVAEIVAMTDRVLEIRLRAPRPSLLQLLAQPEFALVREGQGTGPFRLRDKPGPAGELRLTRRIPAPDGESERREDVWLSGIDARSGVRRFAAGEFDLLLGGTFVDLPEVRTVELPRNSLRFDPAGGLFGLVPARRDGPLENVELRRLLAQAIDRDALIAALDVPGLSGRATILEAGLEGVPTPVTPAWMAAAIGDRRPDLVAAADRLFGERERPVIRIAMPEGPGAKLLLDMLTHDWALLGIRVERAKSPAAADLSLVDLVAPSTSPAWYLRHFRCEVVPLCEPEVDELLEAARAASVPAQRAALLSEAALRIDDAQLFLPIAAPVRWSLVSRRIDGFAGNRFARHTLTDLGQRLGRERAQ